MNNLLNFIQTQTIEQFKASNHVAVIRVKKNPNNNKLFFTYGASVGAVSHKGIPTNPMISAVCPTGETPDMEHIGQEGCNTFYLLHNEGEGAVTVAEF